MAMITCPECEKQISDMAEVCPHCGYPIKKVNAQMSAVRKQQATNSNDDLATAKVEPQPQQVEQNVDNPNPIKVANNIPIENTNKNKSKSTKDSGMSIIAAILALAGWLIVGFFAFVGLIFAIIDLVKGKNDGKRHLGSYFCIVIVVLLLIYSIVSGVSKNNAAKAKETKEAEAIIEQILEEEEKDKEPTDENINIDTTESVSSSYSFPVAADSADMKVGELGEHNGIYVGLPYVKVMNKLTTAVGEEDTKSGHEVVVGFFEIFNGTGTTERIAPENITCYADGTQVEGVDTAFKVVVDGVRQFYGPDLDAEGMCRSCHDFEVPKGWKELKFYYGSDFVWTVTPDDVSSNAYDQKTLFDFKPEWEVVEEDTLIYSGDYKIKYAGYEFYKKENVVWGDSTYVVFKFKIKNTSNEALDYSLAGYEMRAYQNNILLDDADFVLDEKIGGFSNIYNIDSIQPDMQANIYVAFEADDIPGDLCLAYDDGYIFNTNKGYVYIKR